MELKPVYLMLTNDTQIGFFQIDKHIRRLDTDLHRLQAEVKAERAAAAASAAAANPPPQEQPNVSPRDSNGDVHTPGGTQRKRCASS